MVKTNYVLAAQLLGILHKKFVKRKFPYNLEEAQPPQIAEHMPKSFASDRDKAVFFFLLCLYMRGRIKSHTAARGMTRMYETWPELFQPELSHSFDKDVVNRRLQEVGLGFASTSNSRFWVENMQRLQNHWQGDPRNLFVDVTSYDELCGRICNPKTKRKTSVSHKGIGFLGFQKKMASMLIYYLLDAKLILEVRFPWPVDFHVIRWLAIHEILVTSHDLDKNLYHEEVLAAARELSLWYSQWYGVDPLHLSELLWCFSRAMCSKYPGNVSTYQGERRDHKTTIKPKPLVWSRSQRVAYLLSCGQCPVANTCKHSIPAAEQYLKGNIKKRGPRVEQPQLQLYPPPNKIIMPEKRDWKKDKIVHEPNARQAKLFEP